MDSFGRREPGGAGRDSRAGTRSWPGRRASARGAAFDVAVVGAGVFGAWTAYHLQRAGRRVALIDAYGPGNARGSSGGQSRVIRMGYGDQEIYTRWSMRSLELWKALLAPDRAGRRSSSRPGCSGWRASRIR